MEVRSARSLPKKPKCQETHLRIPFHNIRLIPRTWLLKARGLRVRGRPGPSRALPRSDPLEIWKGLRLRFGMSRLKVQGLGFVGL